MQLQLVFIMNMTIAGVYMEGIIRIVWMIVLDGSGFQHLDILFCAGGSVYSIQILGKLAIMSVT